VALYRSFAVLCCANEVILLTYTNGNIVFLSYLHEELPGKFYLQKCSIFVFRAVHNWSEYDKRGVIQLRGIATRPFCWLKTVSTGNFSDSRACKEGHSLNVLLPLHLIGQWNVLVVASSDVV